MPPATRSGRAAYQRTSVRQAHPLALLCLTAPPAPGDTTCPTVCAAPAAKSGRGGISARAFGRQASFVALLTFNEPAAGGNITVDILGPNPAGGAQISAAIMLYVAPRR